MNEPGINSFDELLFFYLAVTIVIGSLWVILEADVLLGPAADAAGQRRRQLAVLHALAVLGVLHPAFALTALDAARVDDETLAADAVALRRIRHHAKVAGLVGVAWSALVCVPYLPVVGELPGVEGLGDLFPWETS